MIGNTYTWLGLWSWYIYSNLSAEKQKPIISWYFGNKAKIIPSMNLAKWLLAYLAFVWSFCAKPSVYARAVGFRKATATLASKIYQNLFLILLTHSEKQHQKKKKRKKSCPQLSGRKYNRIKIEKVELWWVIGLVEHILANIDQPLTTFNSSGNPKNILK